MKKTILAGVELWLHRSGKTYKATTVKPTKAWLVGNVYFSSFHGAKIPLDYYLLYQSDDGEILVQQKAAA